MSYTPEQMQAIFTPGTVAVVGVPRSFKPGLVFLQALLDPGFRGEVFPINPKAGEILGLTDASFNERFGGSPVERIGPEQLKRNARICRANARN